jgi:hypothetical protein
MENTQQNKEKFIAQYWGQKVLNRKRDGVYTLVTAKLSVYEILESDHLLLRDLSSITDEELLDIYYIERVEISTSDEQKIIIAKYWIMHSLFSYAITDYLRSKGFLVPFMDLSVEEIIEYGWAKIKQ